MVWCCDPKNIFPMPHNNIWIHHHRKFVIDSLNRKKFINTINYYEGNILVDNITLEVL